MKCIEAESLIAEKVLGFISDARKKELEDHLVKCPHCRQEAEHYLVTVQALKSGISEKVAPGLPDRVVCLARSGRKRRFRLVKLGVPALAAAAVLLAIIITPAFFSGNNHDMTRLEVLEAYAEDMESLGMGSDFSVYDTEFSYENYGVPRRVTEYLTQ